MPSEAVPMAPADLLARTVIFPYQLPLGLFASLVGGSPAKIIRPDRLKDIQGVPMDATPHPSAGARAPFVR